MGQSPLKTPAHEEPNGDLRVKVANAGDADTGVPRIPCGSHDVNTINHLTEICLISLLIQRARVSLEPLQGNAFKIEQSLRVALLVFHVLEIEMTALA